MRVELSTNHWIKKPAEVAVENAAKLGFRDIQIGTPHYKANFDKLLELKKEHNLTYSVHSPFLAEKDFIASPSLLKPNELDRARKIFLKSLDNAHYIGAKKIVIHTSEPHHDGGIPQLVETLDILCKKAGAYDQILCLENKTKSSNIGFTEEDVLGVFNEVDNPNLRLCFDTAHATCATSAVTKMLDFLYDAAKYVGDVHLTPSDTHRDIHTAPDPEPYFYENVIKILKDAGYKGDLTFEAAFDTDEHIVKGMKYIQGLLKKYGVTND